MKNLFNYSKFVWQREIVQKAVKPIAIKVERQIKQEVEKELMKFKIKIGTDVDMLVEKAAELKSPAIMKYLANHPYVWVRWRLATHLKTPLSVLRLLSKDKSWRVREGVVMNSNIPFSMLKQLSRDRSKKVKETVKLYLSIRKDEDIEAQAKKLERLSKHKDEEVRVKVAINPYTPERILGKLSKDESARVRTCVASNIMTPKEVLVRLSKDTWFKVRAEVAFNKRTPVKTLIKLSRDENPWVRECVASNIMTPIWVLEKLYDDHYSCEVTNRALITLKLLQPFIWKHYHSHTHRR